MFIVRKIICLINFYMKFLNLGNNLKSLFFLIIGICELDVIFLYLFKCEKKINEM